MSSGNTEGGDPNLDKPGATFADQVRCPRCGDLEPVAIVYGLPTFEMFQASERGEFALGGCVMEPTSPDRRCRTCSHEWSGGLGPRFEGMAGIVMSTGGDESAVDESLGSEEMARIIYDIDRGVSPEDSRLAPMTPAQLKWRTDAEPRVAAIKDKGGVLDVGSFPS